ncbi:MAG: EamA/RhaT family transporter [Pusillimonas sp.]
MLLLILSIGCSVAVSVLLKIARRQNIPVGQAIAVNYIVAGVLCLILLSPPLDALRQPSVSWGILGALGLLLPGVFLVMAAAVRHAGIVLSDAAQRLSLLVPLVAAFLWFGESFSPQKLVAIGIAFLALLALLVRPAGAHRQNLMTLTYLLGVWLGYGTIDILFKETARQGTAFAATLLGAFVLAGIVMFTGLALRRTQWQRKGVIGGLALGLLNFGNIYFYISAHQAFPTNPSLVFASMNIGVITLGTLVGALLFKEKLSRTNLAGIVLAITAIGLLYPR